MPPAMKFSDAKVAVDIELEKVEKMSAWALEQVKRKKERILETQKDKTKVFMCRFRQRGVRSKI